MTDAIGRVHGTALPGELKRGSLLMTIRCNTRIWPTRGGNRTVRWQCCTRSRELGESSSLKPHDQMRSSSTLVVEQDC